MDSNRIKRLATGAREALRAEVYAKLDAVLAEGSRERLEAANQVRAIEADMRSHGRDELVDRAAYTWFNRLCALRFMDANGYTTTPVVTPRPGSTQPAILADAAQGVFDPEYGISQDVRQRVTGLLAGLVASTNAAEDAYALLLGAVCAHYAGPMGYLFAEGAASSLLMPQGLLAQGSILSRIVGEMDGDACAGVEVLGWLYQFYIAERKDEYFASKKKATAADIPAATQLFTPRWIVAFLTENSLGRLWMFSNPDSELAGSMAYFVAPEGDEPYVEVSSADEIRVLDPACGSGHILVYAFDLLFRMYEEEGWPTEDIPEMILRNNLFGLEIDRRAAEIASFALEMKARERDPRFFERDVDANVHVLEPVDLLPQELELVPQLAERRGLLEAMAHLDEVGSLYVPDGLDEFVLTNELEHVEHDGSLFAESTIAKLRIMLASVQALNRSFHCVIANPPYIGSGSMNAWYSDWIKAHYENCKDDVCYCFDSRMRVFASPYSAIVMKQGWMFDSRPRAMREEVLKTRRILAMAHLGVGAFGAISGEKVTTAAFIAERKTDSCTNLSVIIDLTGPKNEAEKEALLRREVNDPDERTYQVDADSFLNIPGNPLAYWAPTSLLKAFSTFGPISKFVDTRHGLVTGNNDLFMRCWWEVSYRKFNSSESDGSGYKWVPYSKGGTARRWYGNRENCILWAGDGAAIKNYSGDGSRIKSSNYNPGYEYRAGITWSDVRSEGGYYTARFSPSGGLFDTAGPTLFCDSDSVALWTIAFLNCSVAQEMLNLYNRGLHYTTGSVGSLPGVIDSNLADIVQPLANSCIDVTKDDWNAFETSWGFTYHPLVKATHGLWDATATAAAMEYYYGELPEVHSQLELCWLLWQGECWKRFNSLKSNEEELNRIFTHIYHMEGEVPIEVPDDKVSVRLADRARDARSLISYGIGCMFGRYSTYSSGLVLADQGSTLGDFEGIVPHARFLPDEDNVLPVLADEWFDDDIVAGFRVWLAGTFSEETVDENVAWLEESIGRDLRTYLVRDFYADHLKTYQKRPIYWMFQSPKKSFQCLVYMHRYDEGTVGTILTGYLRPLEDKLRARLQVLESPSASAADAREANRVRSMIAELEQWEREVIYPLAHERVSVDLDDGVKVNYNKFPRALAKVPGLSDWK